jgi:hypothetical protein
MTEIERLVGKNVLEVITALPNFSWKYVENSGEEINTRIATLFFVYYQKKKPRTKEDIYKPVNVENGLTPQDIAFIQEEERCMGIISKVQLGEPYGDSERRFAHIPLLDFDTDPYFNFMNEGDLIKLIKKEITDKLELRKGFLLRSSSKRNYHFIAADRLLSETDFITFCGLALGIKHRDLNERWVNLADSRQIGHGLSPMKYIPELKRGRKWSRYDFPERFLTLRLTPKTNGGIYPIVVDTLRC